MYRRIALVLVLSTLALPALAGPPLFYFPEGHPDEPPPEFKEPASVFLPAP